VITTRRAGDRAVTNEDDAENRRATTTLNDENEESRAPNTLYMIMKAGGERDIERRIHRATYYRLHDAHGTKAIPNRSRQDHADTQGVIQQQTAAGAGAEAQHL
jgi:hypothetical protein